MSLAASPSAPLQSWKEIANYLHRGVRTVQRWQKMGLPVRRLGGGPKAPVMADPRDLDRWLQGAQLHGFGTPQPGEHLICAGLLRDSLLQARQLRQEMSGLRVSHRASMVRLGAALASVKKSCTSRSAIKTDGTHSARG